MNPEGILRTGVGLSKMLTLCALILCATTTSYAIPRFVGSSRLFEISQEGRFSRQAPAVERIETAASFYDFYSASSHTGFEYTRRSLVFLYRDLRDEDNLSIFLLHGVDDMGQPAHLRQPSGQVRGCVRGIPAGARVAVADDNTNEFNWSAHCNGRPTGNGPFARGYWGFGNNTDGGAIDRIRTDVDWEIEIDIELFGAMDEWRYFMADGADIVLDTNLPLIIRSRAENAGDAAQSAEGESMTVCALAVDNANPPHLNYTFNWNDGSEPSRVQLPPGRLACRDHVFPDSGRYVVRIDVADPQGRGVSKNFEAEMQPAPPRLYPIQGLEGITDIPVALSVRAEDGSADVHRSRWDFDNDGRWDTDWVDGVETNHIFRAARRHTVRVEVIDNENLSATTEFEIPIVQRVPRCGDGVHDPNLGEGCDDGNDEERDRCGGNCQVRPRNPEVSSSAACRMREGLLRCPAIDSPLGAAGPGSVVIDLSASIDPDSRDPLRFQYAINDRLGRVVQDPQFRDIPGDMGPVVEYIPAGDGARIDTITVQVFDAEGNVSRATVPVQIPNTPPTFESVEYSQRLAPPQLLFPNENDGWPVESMGRGRHRLTLPVDDAPNIIVTANYVAREIFNERLTVSIDHNGDGARDRALFEAGGREVQASILEPRNQSARGFASFVVREAEFPEGRDELARSVNLFVSDGDPGGEVSHPQRLWVQRIDDEAEQYRYNIDVGNNGSFETVNSLTPTVEFVAPPGTVSVPIQGFSVAPNGDRFPFEIDAVVLPNEPPEFRSVRVVSQDAFDVVILASASDPDGESVDIRIDWGDGQVSTGRNVVYRHSYANARFQVYTIRIRATDERGLTDEAELSVDIVRPAIREADINGLTWSRTTATEGDFDGVRGFAIDPAGTLFSHNYMDMVRRSTDGGDNWVDLLRDVECCGAIATKNAGEVFIASPAGLYFSSDNGDNWELYDESKYKGVAVSPDQNYIVAATKDELKRFDTTGRLIDTHRIVGEFNDLEACAAGNRSGLTTRTGQLYINDRRDMNPAGWRIPEDRFGKSKGESSVSFDKACNLYQGMWNGYRILKADNSIIPSAVKVPGHLFHILGSNSKNIYGGSANTTAVLAWPDGAAIVGSDRGVWGENEPWNAYRKPYWKKRDRGVDRSKSVRHIAMHPTNGHAYLATSSAVQVPKYCRKARRGNRRGRRRGRRARVQYYYVFCGFKQNFFGGVYRSEAPLLLSRTVGEGGSAFDNRNARGVAYDGNAGGLIIAQERDAVAPLWLTNTAESTVSKWTPSNRGITETAKYRVGLPAGECPGQCCWDDGCNMPGPVAVDDAGDAYIVSRGYGMQGTVTKIAGHPDRCADRNNNGRIETARGSDALDYGADECVLWTRPVGPVNAVLRSIAIDQGGDQAPDGYVWVGGYLARTLWKLDPASGRTLAEVDLRLEPFGLMVDSTGLLWVSTLGVGNLQTVDTASNRVNQVIFDQPRALRDGGQSSYGLAIDAQGRIWQNGWDVHDAIAYQPATGEWCRMVLPDDLGNIGRGLTVDRDGRVWTAVGGDDQSHLAWWDAGACQPGQSVDVPRGQVVRMPAGIEGPTALSADAQGHVWLAHHVSPKLLRVTPRDNFRVQEFDGTNRVFSFSDVSGLLRRISIGQGSYSHDFEAECDNPQWTALSWNARTPRGSAVSFSIQTAGERDKLSEGAAIQAGRSPDDEGPINISGRLNAEELASRRFLRVRAALSMGDGGRSPVLQTFTVRWSCD